MTTKKQTKAERIFKSTYYASKRHIDDWGYDGSAWNRLDTEEAVSMRTVNAIQKLIDSQARTLDDFEKYGCRTAEENEIWRQALEMTQKTLDHTREDIQMFNAYLKHEISFDEYLAKAF